jgi:lysine 2,3-aminomutase
MIAQYELPDQQLPGTGHVRHNIFDAGRGVASKLNRRVAVQSARKTLSRPEQLVAAGLLDRERLAEVMQVAERYALALTPDIADLIDDLHDPIARQFIPTKAELQLDPEETSDPIGDEQHSPVPGIVHRYPDRVLLTPVYVCAAYCRFCFRREVVGRQRALSPAQLRAALEYIRNHEGIWEVILSGGDPLVLSVRRLAGIMQTLAAIDHVRVIRVHTRVPVAAPGRVRRELVRALQSSGKATYVVLHANHAKELTRTARTACARLVDAGLPMLSQTVLLRGVNDDADTLGELMRVLVENRIKPYYLHHPDLAPGTAHWRTDIAHGQSLMRVLRGRLSGLCQPNYVLDIPGGHGKSPIGPTYIASIGELNETARYEIEDYNGKRHLYPPQPGLSSPTNGVQGSQIAPRRRGPG